MPTLTEEQIPPEEEELFREFQAYVRSVYGAATSGAIDVLDQHASALGAQISKLTQTVEASRAAYTELFAPAVANFEASSQQIIASLDSNTRTALASLRTETETIVQRRIEALDQRVSEMLAAQRILKTWVVAMGGSILVFAVGILAAVLMGQ
ncbi:MAG: hypothetical protein GX446_15500 [Chthonomonadales bacterium]|nr:hypothetical protein [Chthonomonadales bacterium]